MLILCIILFILLIISIYGLYICYKKIDVYEQIIEERTIWVETIRSKLNDVEQTLKTIDIRGSFEADDEVGIIFKQIKLIINYIVDLSKNGQSTEKI